MDLADLVHLTLHHLTPGANAERRDEWIAALDAQAESHERLNRARARRRFALKPAVNGRGG